MVDLNHFLSHWYNLVRFWKEDVKTLHPVHSLESVALKCLEGEKDRGVGMGQVSCNFPIFHRHFCTVQFTFVWAILLLQQEERTLERIDSSGLLSLFSV